MMKNAVFCIMLLGLLPAEKQPQASVWQTLAPGMELKQVAAQKPAAIGDSRLTILRIDPRKWDLVFAGISQTGGADGKTARQWCAAQQFAAAINAGMFDDDYSTHVGYLKAREHINSSQVNEYQSVAAFGARLDSLPPFRIFDLDEPGVRIETIRNDYALVVQNLRLIKRPGLNRWSQTQRKWSEAALGEDAAGRILFIFVRSPFTMHDLNAELLAAGIDLVAAQHLEGGPEAQLYLQAGGIQMELFGSYETGFRGDDRNLTPWPIPNVIGVRQKPAAR